MGDYYATRTELRQAYLLYFAKTIILIVSNHLQLFGNPSDSAVSGNNPEDDDDDDSEDESYESPVDIHPPAPTPVLPPRACLTRTDSQRDRLRNAIAKEIDEVSEQVE